MQVLEAGSDKYLLLEIEPESVANIARQVGFEIKIDDGVRVMSVELSASDRQAPLLLFDAADPGNLGWFSRCNFYVDGRTGAVLQTPIILANIRDRSGRNLPLLFFPGRRLIKVRFQELRLALQRDRDSHDLVLLETSWLLHRCRRG